MNVTPITDLRGAGDRPITGSRWQQGERPSGRTAVVLPGQSYPAEAPITFYTKLVFLSHGWDWWSIDYRYSENTAWCELSQEARGAYWREEFTRIGEYLRRTLQTEELVIVAKSLGTIALHHMLTETDLRSAAAKLGYAMLTPTGILGQLLSVAVEYNDPALLVIGSADTFYNEAVVNHAQSLPNVRTTVIPDAGHALEKEGDIQQSIANLGLAASAIEDALVDRFL
jgi:pimeloyl-ACP methyl ester carboxylesterase